MCYVPKIGESIGDNWCPKAKVSAGAHEVQRVLLEEHDSILRSYQAQKHGSGNGMGAIAGQRMDFGLGPV